MRIHPVPVSPWQANCYLVAPDAGDRCVVVDPGVTGAAQIFAALGELEWAPAAVVVTHGHLDHTGDAHLVAQRHGVCVYCPRADQPMLAKPSLGLGASLAPLIAQLLGADSLPLPADLREADEPFTAAGLSFNPFPAPGHTPGSMLLEVSDGAEEVVLTGDVVFAGSIGRTDLPGGSMPQMRASLLAVRDRYPDDTIFLPGHGPATTMGDERVGNPYLTDDFLKVT